MPWKENGWRPIIICSRKIQKMTMPIKIRKMMILQKRHNAFLDKHRSVLQENKPFVQVCHHGLKRQRGHWSIELFQSKRCAIQLAAERSGRKAGSSKGKWRDDKEKGYQEQSQSSWDKQKWRPDEEDGDGDTPQPRSNKGASDHWSKSRQTCHQCSS